MKRLSTILAACLLMCACSEVAPEGSAVGVASNPNGGPPSGLDHPSLDIPPQSRRVKRLTVQQLRNTLPALAGSDALGPITWRLPFFGGVDAFSENGVGAVLGEPNYSSRVEEPRDVSPLYLKFVDDMSRDVCRTMALHDYAPDDGNPVVLTRFVDKDDLSDADGIDANLRYLSLHLVGEYIAPDDEAGLLPLRTLFNQATDFEDDEHKRAREGWYSVCVALVSSPSFHLY